VNRVILSRHFFPDCEEDLLAKPRNAGPKPGNPGETELAPAGPQNLKPLLPLYAVVFAGFVGYSLMITVFTPMIMSNHDWLLSSDEPMSRRVIVLGILLCLYPLGQFAGSPVLGALSDRFGRKPVLMTSLCFTTGCYALIATALALKSFVLLAVASLLAGLSEANVVAAQSAIADVIAPQERNRFFGYIYLSASSAYIVGPLVGGNWRIPHSFRGSTMQPRFGRR
jgi:MFS family permease